MKTGDVLSKEIEQSTLPNVDWSARTWIRHLTLAYDRWLLHVCMLPSHKGHTACVHWHVPICEIELLVNSSIEENGELHNSIGNQGQWKKVKVLVSQSCLTSCNSTDLPGSSPWDSPGKNTGVGCHSHLQGIFETQGSNPGLLHCRQNLYYLIHQGSSCLMHIPQWIDSYPMRTKYDQKFSGSQKWRASWWTHRKNDAKGNKIQGSEKCLLKSIAKSLNFRGLCIQKTISSFHLKEVIRE